MSARIGGRGRGGHHVRREVLRKAGGGRGSSNRRQWRRAPEVGEDGAGERCSALRLAWLAGEDEDVVAGILDTTVHRGRSSGYGGGYGRAAAASGAVFSEESDEAGKRRGTWLRQAA